MTDTRKLDAEYVVTPIGSVWRTETGAYVRVVHTDGAMVYVRNANGKGHTWSVLPAWFVAPVSDGGMERAQ